MATGIAQTIIDQQKWIDNLSDAVQPVVGGAFRSAGGTGKMVKDLLNGVWLGHPLHPVITDVPVGAWTISELLDLVSAATGDDEGLDLAADITLAAGIVAAVGAALTGITDWSDSEGEQRRLGMAHAVLNVGGLTLNLGSLLIRAGGGRNGRGVARALSALGYITSSTAAYIGGELVYNLGQAINRNAWVDGPSEFTDVGAETDLQQGKMVRMRASGKSVVLVRDDDGIHAFGGICPHFGCTLWDGELSGHNVTCPCHGSEFNITDGSVIHGPATAPVPSYDVRVQEGRVQVRLRQ